MQFRLWWNAMALAVTLLASSAAFAAPIPATEIPREFEAAKGTAAVDYKEKVLANAPPSATIVDRTRYAGEVGSELMSSKIFLTSSNTEGQISAASCMFSIGTVSSDSCLEQMLTSPNPGVRYWGAKGLGSIASALNAVGAATAGKATVSLNAALAKETSPVVKSQIVRALAAYASAANPDPLIDGMKALAGGMQSTFPDRDTLDTATAIVKTFGALAKGNKFAPAQKLAAAEALANIASFAIQQEHAKPESERPADYHSSVINLINNCFDALNTTLGKNVFRPLGPKDDVDTVLMLVGASVGSPGASGDLQKELPGVPVPPALAKAPAPK